MSFGSFLKIVNPSLYKSFAFEEFKENSNKKVFLFDDPPIPKTSSFIPNIFEDLLPLSSLDKNTPVVGWANKRKLPFNEREFFFAKNFIEWTKGHTDKFKKWKGKDHSRVVMPWRDRNKKIIGYSARDITGLQEQKYYRILLDETAKERFFGLDLLDEAKQVYVLEGEIDSMMIPNAIAVANGKLQVYHNPKAIYVPDSDVRNKHIMKNVEAMINDGLQVCMLPTNLPGKDLNELAQAGLSSTEILDIIKQNTFQGLTAKLEFTRWSKM